jgi:hypothetical protein
MERSRLRSSEPEQEAATNSSLVDRMALLEQTHSEHADKHGRELATAAERLATLQQQHREKEVAAAARFDELERGLREPDKTENARYAHIPFSRERDALDVRHGSLAARVEILEAALGERSLKYSMKDEDGSEAVVSGGSSKRQASVEERRQEQAREEADAHPFRPRARRKEAPARPHSAARSKGEKEFLLRQRKGQEHRERVRSATELRCMTRSHSAPRAGNPGRVAAEPPSWETGRFVSNFDRLQESRISSRGTTPGKDVVFRELRESLREELREANLG